MCKISIITASYNSESNISNALKSVYEQRYIDFEHIIIDGGSSDRTIDIINNYKKTVNNKYKIIFISEPDFGIYDALNKGYKLCSADYILLLHSDDEFYDENVLDTISKEISQNKPDIMWSNLIFIKNGKKYRLWKSSKYKNIMLGWIPPHPTLVIRKTVIKKIGNYDISYKISSDYDYMLRIFSGNYKLHYFDRYLYKMKIGGVSTKKSLILNKLIEDLQILKKKYSYFSYFVYIFKILRKITQFQILQKNIHSNFHN